MWLRQELLPVLVADGGRQCVAVVIAIGLGLTKDGIPFVRLGSGRRSDRDRRSMFRL